MPAIDPRLIAAFIWIVGCLLATLWMLLRRPARLPGFGYALAAALLIRLIPALMFPRGARWEVDFFQQTAQVAFKGQNIYSTELPYFYPPLHLGWLATAYWLTGRTSLMFVFWLKVPNILADIAMTGLVYSAIRRTRPGDDALFGSWIYAVNPVTTLVTAYQGQFDAIPLFLMVAAWYLFESHSDRKWGVTFSSLVLGLGVLSKSWPVIFLPIALLRLPHWGSRLKYAAGTTAVPVIGTLLYELLFPGSLPLILTNLVGAGAPPGWWGLSAILNVIVALTGYGHGFFALHAQIGSLATLLGGTCTILLTRRRSALYALMMTILTLFAIFPNFGVQYLSWIVPLVTILGMPNELGWYVAGATTHMAFAYWGMHFTDGFILLMPTKTAGVIVQLSSLTAWGVIMLWGIQELVHKRLLPNIFQSDSSKAQPGLTFV